MLGKLLAFLSCHGQGLVACTLQGPDPRHSAPTKQLSSQHWQPLIQTPFSSYRPFVLLATPFSRTGG